MEFIKAFENLFEKYSPKQLLDPSVITNEVIKIVKNEEGSIKFYQLNYLLTYSSDENFIYSIFNAYKKKFDVMHSISAVMDKFEKDKISPMIYSYFLYCILTVFKIPVREFNWINPTINTLDNESMNLELFFGQGCFMESLDKYEIEGTTLNKITEDRRYLTLPHGITSINRDAFGEMSSTDFITFPESLVDLTPDNLSIKSSLQRVLFSNKVKTVPDSFFKNSSNLFFVSGRGIKEVGAHSFEATRLNTLKNISGARLEKIGDFAFKGCMQLKKVILPHLQEVGITPFYNCLQISELIVDVTPQMIKNKIRLFELFEINGHDMSNYSYFKTITVNVKNGIIPEGFFEDCTTITDIIINGEVKQIGANAFKGCHCLNNLQMNFTGDTLSKGMFEDCYVLEKLPKLTNVTILSEDTFKGCNTLEEINFPTTISKLGSSSFSGCTSLRIVSMKLTAKELPENCFSGCTEIIDFKFLNDILVFKAFCLKGITLPITFKFNNNVEYIAKNAFDSTTFPKNITIPANCTIDKLAFSNVPVVNTLICNNLELVDINKEKVELYQLFEEELSMFLFKFSTLKNIQINSNVNVNSFKKWHQIENVVLSEKVSLVEESAFEECMNLHTVKMESSNISFGKNAFKNCSALTRVRTKNNTFDNDVKGVFDLSVCETIEDGAFFNCNCSDVYFTIEEDIDMNSITLGEVFTKDVKSNVQLINVFVNVEGDSLPNELFKNANTVKNIEIKGKVANLGERLFVGCSSLESLNIDFVGTRIPEGCFEGCSVLKSLPEFTNVSVINNNAFKNCSSIESITFDNHITELGTSAFEGCTNLKDTNFELHCKTLNSFVFKNCDSLKDFFFIKEIEIFESYSLSNFNLVDRFTPPANAKRVKSFAVDGSTLSNELLLRDDIVYEKLSFANVKGINKIIFQNLKLMQDDEVLLPYNLFTEDLNEFIKNVHISSIVVDTNDICEEAFKDWKTVSDITLTQNVHMIPKSTFEGCVSLHSIKFPYYNISLSDSAFANCINLNKIKYDENYIDSLVTTVPTNVFKNCKKITEFPVYIDQFILENNVRFHSYFDESESVFNKQFAKLKTINVINKTNEIPSAFFKNCSKITNINFTNEVSKLNEEVFMNCSSLSSINIEFNGTQLSGNLFANCVKLPTLFKCSNVDTIDEKAFSGCKKISNLSFENKIKIIGNSAFENCISLSNIDMEFTGDTFNKHTFLNCKKLVATPKLVSLTNLEKDAFVGCKSLKIVNISGFKNLGIKDALSNFKNINTLNFYGDTIPDKLFYGVSNINTINFVEEIKYIGNNAFENCVNLKQINRLENVQHIGDYAFKNSSLESIVIPSTIEDFGVGIFAECNSLMEIDVPIRFDFIGTLFSLEESPKSKKLVQSSFSTERTYYLPQSLKTIKVNSGDILEGSFSNVDLNLIINVKLNKIRDYSFYNCSNLELPFMSEIRSIGDYAFAKAHIENLDLSNVTSLGHNAFSEARIDNISIGNKINEIHSSTFSKFKYNNFEIKNNIFYKIESSILIDIKKTIILNVFDSKEELVIPSEIQTLETNTFDSIDIKTIDTNNVRIIKSNAFANCPTLENVKFTKVEKYGQNLFLNCPNVKNLELSFIGAEKINPKTLDYLFDAMPQELNNIIVNGGTLLTNFLRNVRVINELNLTNVRHNVFEEGLFKNVSINKLSLPKTITDIKENAFNNVLINEVVCSEDSLVTYENNYIVANNKIVYAPSLTIDKLTINNEITSVAPSAFKLVEEINEVELTNNELRYTELFENVKTINKITVSNIKDLPSLVFKKSINEIKEIVFTDSVIESQFFKGINNFDKITFTNLCTFDLDYFVSRNLASKSKKININSLIFEKGLNELQEDSFDFMSINSMSIVNNDKYMLENNVLYNLVDNRLIYGCNDVVGEITIPNNIVSTKEGAFRDCSKLNSVIFTNIKELNDNLFENCSNLNNVIINQNCETIGKTIFKNCNNFKLINIPFIGNNIKKTDNLTYLFGKDIYDVSIKQIKLTNQSVINKTFNQHVKLEEIILGNNVSEVNELSFNGCLKLSKVYFNSNIRTLPNYVFTGCNKSLKAFVDKEVVTELGFEWNKLGEDKKAGAVKVVAKVDPQMFI